ncbi:MAG: 50S ribosomal protein L25 [Candidatus Coatesbacteria bacterium]|nr:MAG: 50S ribosomal protein L25 [Candidatus Coatesbacteria bacterium]
MKRMILDAEVREPGPSRARAGRREGKVPAVVYGADKENVAVFVDNLTLRKVLREGGAQALITLKVDGAPDDAETLTILKDVQYDAFGEEITHTDFYRVTLGKPINVTIPLHVVGESPGVQEGGILEHMVRELHISCLPKEIPDHVEISVDTLELNENLTIGDVDPPPGVTILDDSSTLAVLVKPSRIARLAELEEEAAAAAAAAEAEEAEEGEEAPPAEEGEAPSEEGAKPAEEKTDGGSE